MKILEKPGLSFDDVLLVPQCSSIKSRFSEDIDISTHLFPSFSTWSKLQYPIISANMDKVTGNRMANAIVGLGGLGIVHRFLSIKQHVKEIDTSGIDYQIGCIGVGSEGKRRARALAPFCNGFLIDIAHGHCKEMLKQIEWLKREFTAYPIITGNVATKLAATDLINAGVNCIKCGVGCGSLCSTRIHTGCGVPQLTAIMDIAEQIYEVNTPVTLIADGGIRNSGDIVKALAAGADAVMIGNLFAGTDEAPGQVHRDRRTGELYKIYRGLASEEAQLEWKGFVQSVEGESMKVPYKGSVEQIFNGLVAGILSGMSYLNAHNLEELRKNAIFIIQTNAGYHESIPHGLSNEL